MMMLHSLDWIFGVEEGIASAAVARRAPAKDHSESHEDADDDQSYDGKGAAHWYEG